MYSKLLFGLAIAGAASGAELVRRDTTSRDGAHGGGHGGGHGHDHGHGGHDHGGHGGGASISAGYSEPSGGYSAPAQSYSAGASSGYSAGPSSGYSAGPSSGYSAGPSSGYGGSSQSSGYGAPSYGGGYEAAGYEEEGGFDLTAIIIPILVIFGLSLLFPTITSVAVRRKRDVGASPMTDIVERVNDIYLSVVESEECMQRIACEIGGLADDVGLKENSIARLADPFVPTKYKGYYKQFKSGQNCHKMKCGSLF